MSNKQLKSTGLPSNYVSKLSSFSIVTVKVGMNEKETNLFVWQIMRLVDFCFGVGSAWQVADGVDQVAWRHVVKGRVHPGYGLSDVSS